jgi:hypothetical protein
MSLKRDRYFGQTEQEVITGWVEELARDATSLWHIITAGREGFELDGPELIDFVRRSLMALFAAGAKPVMGKIDPDYLWGRVTKYGDDPRQMTDAVIDEWQKSGRDPDAGGIWFATPNVYGERRRGSRG